MSVEQGFSKVFFFSISACFGVDKIKEMRKNAAFKGLMAELYIDMIDFKTHKKLLEHFKWVFEGFEVTLYFKYDYYGGV